MSPHEADIGPGGILNDTAIPYAVPNMRTVARRLETTPLRPAWIRAPGRMQNTFANESFVDELAAAAGAATTAKMMNTSKETIGMRMRRLRRPEAASGIGRLMSSLIVGSSVWSSGR